jgi:type IV pilus assembly protein PilW
MTFCTSWSWRHKASGFSLIELLVAVSLSSFLSLGLIRIASATLASFRLQDSLAEIQESTQVVSTVIGDLLRSSAFHDSPWRDDQPTLLFLPETEDGGIKGNDQLAVMTRSDRNCYGSPNPVQNGAGYPRYYLKKTIIGIRSGSELVLSCSYGVDEDSMTLQIRRQGLIRNVESLQLLFGVDHSSDQSPDDWVRASQLSDESQVIAVRSGLLLSGTESVGPATATVFSVLDQHLEPSADGKLRRIAEFTSVIKGRMP